MLVNPILIAIAALVFLNLLAYGMFALDKYRAQQRGWRIPEGSLLILVALGGGGGAYYAMQRLRHKTRKGSFRLAYWMCVALSLLGWGLHFFQLSL